MRRAVLTAILFWAACAASPPAWAEEQGTGTFSPSPTAPAPQPQAQGPTQAGATPAPAQPGPPALAADPVVALIRAKLSEPGTGKGANPDDLAALQAFYAERSGSPLWVTDMGFTARALAAISEIGKADDWGLSAADFDLPDEGILPRGKEDEAKAEIALDLAVLKYARFARGGRFDPSAISKLFDQVPPVRDPRTVLAEIEAAQAPDLYLRSLQPKHEQFLRLREALLKARAGGAIDGKPLSERDIKKIVINMERWRWMPEDLGSLYLWLNIPAFTVYLYKDGKQIYTDKIVVGELKYATPMFSADLKSVVFNPEWTVPPTIVRENLLPNLRGGGGLFSRNTAILDQHELKVKYNGRFVDPGSINWNTVNMAAISFVQAPGPNNVLGKVKFVYPNPFSVYMHDTIKQGLFDTDMRAEGHNCPRVYKPGKMAAMVLAADQDMPQAEVDKLLASGYNSAVEIKHRLPVHTTYFTATVNDEGKVQTYPDVYKLDGALAAAIGGKTNPDAVADNAPQAKPKPKPQTQSGDLADSAR